MAAKAIKLSTIQADTLYTPRDVAKIRGKSTKTLANERSLRIGPAVHYLGKTPMYLGRDLIADIERSRVDFQTPRTTKAHRRGRAKRAAI